MTNKATATRRSPPMSRILVGCDLVSFPARALTNHNEPKQLAGVRFILGVGKNPVCDRGLILSQHTCICWCSFTFESMLLLQGWSSQLIFFFSFFFTATVIDDSVFGWFVNQPLYMFDRNYQRYILFFFRGSFFVPAFECIETPFYICLWLKLVLMFHPGVSDSFYYYMGHMQANFISSCRD